MALSATELRKGAVFELNGEPYKVLEYTHKMLGRGSSTVVVKIKNLINGAIVEKTFRGSDKVDNADLSNRQMQYLYRDNGSLHFMDPDNFEQFELDSESVGNYVGFMKEGDKVTTQLFEGRVINVELPKNVTLKVTYTEDAVRGDTSSAITKDATLETGIKIKVPAFIKQGDIISIDTETGTYRARAKSSGHAE